MRCARSLQGQLLKFALAEHIDVPRLPLGRFIPRQVEIDDLVRASFIVRQPLGRSLVLTKVKTNTAACTSEDLQLSNVHFNEMSIILGEVAL